MEHQNPNLDIISTLPENITEKILTLMPIRDALRTSVLSKKWRYSWRSMPKLKFSEYMVRVPSDCDCGEMNTYKLINAIFHVLLLHNGPTILVVDISVGNRRMGSNFDLIISYLSRGNKSNNVRELSFTFSELSYRLPVSFFSLQGLESIYLFNCNFEPPLTFNGFSRLRRTEFEYVAVSAKMLQRFLSSCLLLDVLILQELCHEQDFDFVGWNNTFTFVDLLQCVPLIKTLHASKDYMKYLAAGGMPRKLPTSLVHLKYMRLDVCFMKQNEVSSALCLIRSSPLLEEIVFLMYDNEKLHVQQTPTNFLDPENHSDLQLDHLETLEIKKFINSPHEMEFVKLIMSKSPVLKKVRIELNDRLSVDEEVKMLRDMVLLPFPRASRSTKLIIERRKTYR